MHEKQKLAGGLTVYEWKLRTSARLFSVIASFVILLLLVTGCGTASPVSSSKPPQVPPPPAGMFTSELKPSQYYSEKLTAWRKKADERLMTLEKNSLSAAPTLNQ